MKLKFSQKTEEPYGTPIEGIAIGLFDIMKMAQNYSVDGEGSWPVPLACYIPRIQLC